METPDLQGAYPRLSDAQVAALTALGERRAAQPEEVLFREGQRNCDFFVVLEGNVAVVEGAGRRRSAPSPFTAAAASSASSAC
jgi:thioredoxin reductase (NADPH)